MAKIKINSCAFIDLMVVCRDESLSWHKANQIRPLSGKTIQNYAAGFDSGWRAALSTLKAQGLLETES